MKVLVTTAISDESRQRLIDSFPHVEFVCPQDDEVILSSAVDCEALFGGRVSPDVIEAAPALRWVHVRSAGVNHLPLDLLAERGIVLTNGRGAHGQPVAETLLAMILAFAVRLPDLWRGQQNREDVSDRVIEQKFELKGQTLLVIGLGDLGGTLAHKAHCLGMRVLGVRNRPLPPPDGVDELVPKDRLTEAVAAADHVALCLPHTGETDGFFGERELRAMKSTAYIYNAGRGRAIQREPLIRALSEGWIAGAGLDVTDPEPLPPDDPLWAFSNVILTQHTSGGTPLNEPRVVDLFLDNLMRYLAGESLLNRVDYSLSY